MKSDSVLLQSTILLYSPTHLILSYKDKLKPKNMILEIPFKLMVSSVYL